MTRLMKVLNQRRSMLKDNDKGFTLIELLVVVIIIGVLAAIAIPIYIGVQNNAKDSAVKSDLTNAKTAVVSSFTKLNVYPAISTTALKDDGYSGLSVTYAANGDAPNWASTGNAVPAATATTFCIGAKSPTGSQFYITDSSGVVGPISSTVTKPAGCV